MRWKENLVKHWKASKYYETDCRVCLKYLVNDCGFFTGWASLQYRLRNSATYIPFYSSCMNIKTHSSEGNWTANFWLKRENTHCDEMKLLGMSVWKIEILLIIAKTGFCSLIFHMLASYIGPKSFKNFCNILTWQITRKVIVIRAFSRTLL